MPPKRARMVLKHKKELSPSVVEKCPAEVWAEIFELACTDGGPTGRSLSLVSKYINASKSSKYFTLALKQKQFRPLALVLKKLPFNSRRCRHIFAREDNTDAGFFISDLNRLLILVAPTLQTLEVRASKVTLTFPFQFPALVDLVISGTLDLGTQSARAKVRYPALKRLHIDPAGNVKHSQGRLADDINKISPDLTHLRISLEFSWGLFNESVLSLVYNTMEPLSPCAEHCKLPSTVRRFCIQPPGTDWFDRSIPRAMARLRQIAKTNDRFFVLQRQGARNPDWFAAEREWLETRAGGRDCWDDDSDLHY
jgi:hypothetical protein